MGGARLARGARLNGSRPSRIGLPWDHGKGARRPAYVADGRERRRSGRSVAPMRTFLDPYFTVPTRAPFAPGTSPFRQRGALYRDNLEYWEKHVPGGCRALLAVSADESLTRFMSQPFSSFSWYDALPSAAMHLAASRVRQVSLYQQLREHGTFLAERFHNGISGVVLRALSNEAIATWIPRISSFHHEFGSVEAKVAGPGCVRGVRTGMPRMFLQVWAVTSTEIVERVLGRAGARAPRVLLLEPTVDGSAAGYETFRTSFEIRWDT